MTIFAIDGHRPLGPGLIEAFDRESHAFVLVAGFRAEIVAADELIVEIKSIETIQLVHAVHLQAYPHVSNR